VIKFMLHRYCFNFGIKVVTPELIIEPLFIEAWPINNT
jgi:hypothetical protein